MTEHIVCLGLDGERVPVPTREAWALSAEDAAAIHRSAREDGLGACLVSTCFRVELLVSGERLSDDLVVWGRRHLAALRPDAPLGAFTARRGPVALRHLVRVAAGLESAVLGEAQILGQVRRARAAAEHARALTPALRLALRAAVKTGQRVRRVTDLGRGAASTASAAVRLAEASGGIEGRDVVVIGAGQIGRLLMGLLPGARPASLTLVSAHAPPHAGFRVLRPEAFADALPHPDVVFAATDRLALPLDLAQQAWRDGRARTVIDLGVPRNVPAAVAQIPGVSLHDVDALGAVVDAGLQAREAAVPEAERLVDRALETLADDLVGLRREALVADLRRQTERVRRETVARVRQRGEVDPEALSRTLTTRLFHDLTRALRQREDGLDEADLRRLFALDNADG